MQTEREREVLRYPWGGEREREREGERGRERRGERERDANGALNSCALQRPCKLARGDPRTSLDPK